jgi:hypothetical protein
VSAAATARPGSKLSPPARAALDALRHGYRSTADLIDAQLATGDTRKRANLRSTVSNLESAGYIERLHDQDGIWRLTMLGHCAVNPDIEIAEPYRSTREVAQAAPPAIGIRPLPALVEEPGMRAVPYGSRQVLVPRIRSVFDLGGLAS